MTLDMRLARAAVVVAAAVLLLAACGSATTQSVAGPRIQVDHDTFDLGKVPLDKVVSHTFEIKNVGNAPLVLAGPPAVRAVQGC